MWGSISAEHRRNVGAIHTWRQSSRHFNCKFLWLRPEHGHQRALEVLSGADFGRMLHDFSSWARLRRSWLGLPPRAAQEVALMRGASPGDLGGWGLGGRSRPKAAGETGLPLGGRDGGRKHLAGGSPSGAAEAARQRRAEGAKALLGVGSQPPERWECNSTSARW